VSEYFQFLRWIKQLHKERSLPSLTNVLEAEKLLEATLGRPGRYIATENQARLAAG
jgi:hypothetical protein